MRRCGRATHARCVHLVPLDLGRQRKFAPSIRYRKTVIGKGRFRLDLTLLGSWRGPVSARKPAATELRVSGWDLQAGSDPLRLWERSAWRRREDARLWPTVRRQRQHVSP